MLLVLVKLTFYIYGGFAAHLHARQLKNIIPKMGSEWKDIAEKKPTKTPVQVQNIPAKQPHTQVPKRPANHRINKLREDHQKLRINRQKNNLKKNVQKKYEEALAEAKALEKSTVEKYPIKSATKKSTKSKKPAPKQHHL